MDSEYLETVSEDTIQCNFYLKPLNTDSLFLEELCDSVNNTIQKLSEGYIWHRDEFKVYVALNKEKHGTYQFINEHLIFFKNKTNILVPKCLFNIYRF